MAPIYSHELHLKQNESEEHDRNPGPEVALAFTRQHYATPVPEPASPRCS
ncbi:hypothetical protein GCM10025779_09820 [Arthrobacter cryoconiti]